MKDLTLAHVKSHLQVRALALPPLPTNHLQTSGLRTNSPPSSHSQESLVISFASLLVPFFLFLLFGSDKNANAVTPDGE